MTREQLNDFIERENKMYEDHRMATLDTMTREFAKITSKLDEISTKLHHASRTVPSIQAKRVIYDRETKSRGTKFEESEASDRRLNELYLLSQRKPIYEEKRQVKPRSKPKVNSFGYDSWSYENFNATFKQESLAEVKGKSMDMSAELRCKPRSKIVSEAKKLKCLRCLKIGHSSIQCPNWFVENIRDYGDNQHVDASVTDDILLPSLVIANIPEVITEKNCKFDDSSREEEKLSENREQSCNKIEKIREEYVENHEKKENAKEREFSENRSAEICEYDKSEKQLSVLASQSVIESTLIAKEVFTNNLYTLLPSFVFSYLQKLKDPLSKNLILELNPLRGKERQMHSDLCCLYKGKIQLHMVKGKFHKESQFLACYNTRTIAHNAEFNVSKTVHLQFDFIILKKHTLNHCDAMVSLYSDFCTLSICKYFSRVCVHIFELIVRDTHGVKLIQFRLIVYLIGQYGLIKILVVLYKHFSIFVCVFHPNDIKLLQNDCHQTSLIPLSFIFNDFSSFDGLRKVVFVRKFVWLGAEVRANIKRPIDQRECQPSIRSLSPMELPLGELLEQLQIEKKKDEFAMKVFDPGGRFLFPTTDSRTNPFEERGNDTNKGSSKLDLVIQVNSFPWDPGISWIQPYWRPKTYKKMD